MKKKIYKVILNNGLVLTIEVTKETKDKIFGKDKFGNEVIVSISEIKLKIPKI